MLLFKWNFEDFLFINYWTTTCFLVYLINWVCYFMWLISISLWLLSLEVKELLVSKSISISMCKILQNRKTCSFYTFWAKNTHISGCKIVHLCTIATVSVHICIVTVALLSIFFLSPFSCLVRLSLTHSSMPRRRRRRRSRPSQQPSTANHHHCNLVPPTTNTTIQTHYKIIKIILNLDPNSSNPYTNSYK